MNKEWHRQNPMPLKASEQERLNWHLEHQRQCGCRPIPASLVKLLDQRPTEVEVTDKSKRAQRAPTRRTRDPGPRG